MSEGSSSVARQIPFDNSTNGYIAQDVQAAIEEGLTIAAATNLALFGDGSDGDVSLSSGTTTLARTMYYNSLTLSSTAVVDVNGYGIYVKGTLALSGTSSVISKGGAGGNATGTTAGIGGIAPTGVDVSGGVNGVLGGAGGAIASNGAASASIGGTIVILGGTAGTAGAGGASGVRTGGNAGTGTSDHHPIRTVLEGVGTSIRSSRRAGMGGNGGGGGAGAATLTTGGGGGGGGASGGMISIYAHTFNNTSSVGLDVRAGNGGNGAQGGVNAGGGGAGAGGGGGYILIVCQTMTAVGNVIKTGGTKGTPGAANGTGLIGVAATDGGAGRMVTYVCGTNTWTVT